MAAGGVWGVRGAGYLPLPSQTDQKKDQNLSKGTEYNVKKANLSLEQAVEAHRVVRRRGSHIF
jgi:hypothetical protein